MRIAITGASGNVGSALVERLLAEDRHEVVGIARRPPDDRRVEWHPVDLTREADRPRLEAALRGAGAVVHLAWGFQPSHRTDLLAELGIGGTRRVAEAVAATGVPHLVHLSSVGAYSPRHDHRPVGEDHPTGGISSSPYSRHKVAAERILDRFEARTDVVVTRVRPGIVGQARAGSALLRYGVPALVPARVVRALPVLPLDADVEISMVHADDVADALARIVANRAPGPFNLAAGSVTADQVAEALGARRVPLPTGVLRAVASVTWHLRLQPVDPGWIDLATQVPVLDSTRAGTELGWSPRHAAPEVLAEVVAGMASADHGGTPVLRERSVRSEVAALVREGAVSRRSRP